MQEILNEIKNLSVPNPLISLIFFGSILCIIAGYAAFFILDDDDGWRKRSIALAINILFSIILSLFFYFKYNFAASILFFIISFFLIFPFLCGFLIVSFLAFGLFYDQILVFLIISSIFIIFAIVIFLFLESIR